ncbi:hypothetical protein ACIQVU_19420 [Lysinibacillus sp. NPDC098008]|uniref:hypothetical protein n=1 Tax=Lysinibacillus TaxID=400634 RepID=UPI0003719FB6|nr:hypothetical protein [Lysinibacillus boronitolerans]
MTVEERKRKVRSDKKRDIKPTISLELKDSIYRLSFITRTPVKDVSELLLKNALFENTDILKSLSKNFIRDIRINNTFYIGNLQNERIAKTEDGETDRISFRLKNDVYEILRALSYALDCSVSRIAAILLYESIIDKVFIERYVESYLDSLDKSRKKELKQVLKYIRKETDESYNLVDLLSYLVDEPIRWTFPK